jgi:hypothetical protein
MNGNDDNVVDLIDVAPHHFARALVRRYHRRLVKVQTKRANARHQFKLARALEWSREHGRAATFFRRAAIVCLVLGFCVFLLHGRDYLIDAIMCLIWATFCVFVLKMFDHHRRTDQALLDRAALAAQYREAFVRQTKLQPSNSEHGQP